MWRTCDDAVDNSQRNVGPVAHITAGILEVIQFLDDGNWNKQSDRVHPDFATRKDAVIVGLIEQGLALTKKLVSRTT